MRMCITLVDARDVQSIVPGLKINIFFYLIDGKKRNKIHEGEKYSYEEGSKQRHGASAIFSFSRQLEDFIKSSRFLEGHDLEVFFACGTVLGIRGCVQMRFKGNNFVGRDRY